MEAPKKRGRPKNEDASAKVIARRRQRSAKRKGVSKPRGRPKKTTQSQTQNVSQVVNVRVDTPKKTTRRAPSRPRQQMPPASIPQPTIIQQPAPAIDYTPLFNALQNFNPINQTQRIPEQVSNPLSMAVGNAMPRQESVPVDVAEEISLKPSKAQVAPLSQSVYDRLLAQQYNEFLTRPLERPRAPRKEPLTSEEEDFDDTISEITFNEEGTILPASVASQSVAPTSVAPTSVDSNVATEDKYSRKESMNSAKKSLQKEADTMSIPSGMFKEPSVKEPSVSGSIESSVGDFQSVSDSPSSIASSSKASSSKASSRASDFSSESSKSRRPSASDVSDDGLQQAKEDELFRRNQVVSYLNDIGKEKLTQLEAKENLNKSLLFTPHLNTTGKLQPLMEEDVAPPFEPKTLEMELPKTPKPLQEGEDESLKETIDFLLNFEPLPSSKQAEQESVSSKESAPKTKKAQRAEESDEDSSVEVSKSSSSTKSSRSFGGASADSVASATSTIASRIGEQELEKIKKKMEDPSKDRIRKKEIQATFDKLASGDKPKLHQLTADDLYLIVREDEGNKKKQDKLKEYYEENKSKRNTQSYKDYQQMLDLKSKGLLDKKLLPNNRVKSGPAKGRLRQISARELLNRADELQKSPPKKTKGQELMSEAKSGQLSLFT